MLKGSSSTKPGRPDEAQDDGISAPVFVFTDAQPRNDLYCLLQDNAPGQHGSDPSSHPPRRNMLEASSASQQPYSNNPANLLPPAPLPPRPWSNASDVNASGEIIIGMALGNPSTAHLQPTVAELSGVDPLWNVKRNAFSPTPPAPLETIAANDVKVSARQRSRWRTLGGLFSKKRASVAPTLLDKRRALGLKADQCECGSRETLVMRNTDRPRNTKIGKKLPKSAIKARVQTPQVVRRGATPPPRDYPRPTGRNGSSDKPMMLQVDIPDVSMERYSIMFGHVLKPRQPSIMVRRQAVLEKLRSIDNEPPAEKAPAVTGYLVPLRSMSCSNPPASPSFSLFPKTTSKKPSLSKDLPLRRSATSPASRPPALVRMGTSSSTVADPGSDVLAKDVSTSPSQSSASPSSRGQVWSSAVSVSSTEESLIGTDDEPKYPKEDEPPEEETPKFVEPHRTLSNRHVQIHSKPPHVQPQRRLLKPIWPIENAGPVNPRLPSSSYRMPVRSSSASIGTPQQLYRTRSQRQQDENLNSQIEQLQEENDASRTPTTALRTNPLTSSPPSQTEISMARSMSVSRRRRQADESITPKTVEQPKAVIVDGHGARGHVKQKSHHLVVEHA